MLISRCLFRRDDVSSMNQIRRVMTLAVLFAVPAGAQTPATPPDLASQVEVLRTTHGVPHIRAQNLKAAAYALAYVQLEDYGPRVAYALVRSQGQMGRWFGHDSIDGDFGARLAHEIAVRQYPTLDQNTRDVYEGFAAGANRYVELHPEEFLPGFNPQFTGYDVAAKDVRDVRRAETQHRRARVRRGRHDRR